MIDESTADIVIARCTAFFGPFGNLANIPLIENRLLNKLNKNNIQKLLLERHGDKSVFGSIVEHCDYETVIRTVIKCWIIFDKDITQLPDEVQMIWFMLKFKREERKDVLRQQLNNIFTKPQKGSDKYDYSIINSEDKLFGMIEKFSKRFFTKKNQILDACVFCAFLTAKQ